MVSDWAAVYRTKLLCFLEATGLNLNVYVIVGGVVIDLFNLHKQ